MPSLTTPPPDWIQQGKFTWGGIVTIKRASGEDMKGLAYRYPQTGNCSDMNVPASGRKGRPDSDSGCHSYLQVTDDPPWDGRPLLFTFPAAGGLQDWHFEPETEHGKGIDESTFALPPGCADALCPKPSATLRTPAASWPASYWA